MLYLIFVFKKSDYAVHSLMIIVGLVELICAIWTSVLSCKTTCCQSSLVSQYNKILTALYPNQQLLLKMSVISLLMSHLI